MIKNRVQSCVLAIKKVTCFNGIAKMQDVRHKFTASFTVFETHCAMNEECVNLARHYLLKYFELFKKQHDVDIISFFRNSVAMLWIMALS